MQGLLFHLHGQDCHRLIVSKAGGCALDLSESADSDVLLSAAIECYASYASCILLWHSGYEPPLEGIMDMGKAFLSHSSDIDSEAVQQYCADSLVFTKLRVADSKLHMTNIGDTCMASSCNTHFYRMACSLLNKPQGLDITVVWAPHLCIWQRPAGCCTAQTKALLKAAA